MGSRGAVTFALLFLVLPVLGILGATFLTGGGAIGLAMASIALLVLGFTVGLFLLE